MALRVAIQMDPIASINFHSDSTLRLGFEAQMRGHELWVYTPDKLTYHHGAITAHATRVMLYDDHARYYEFIGEQARIDLRDMQVILLRQDPPFDMTYLTTTNLQEQLSPQVLVVNDPKSVRNHPEKLFPTLLREFMPPTLITADINEIAHFRAEYKDIIIKPLYGYGGRAVLHLKETDDNFDGDAFFNKS